jgi:hypothetical protein
METNSFSECARSMCKEKERLWKAHKIAFDIYVQSTADLAEAAGTIADEDFEFLQNWQEDAKLFLLSARQQLNEHSAKRGC